jgi:hypothetical protein
MPVLRQCDVIEAPGKPIDDRHDRIAVRHGKRTTGAEIVLDIDDQQQIVIFRLDRHFEPVFTLAV